MRNEKEEKPHKPLKMQKRRILMEDGRRYLIFYTFEDEQKPLENDQDKEKADV